jgi:hypothetical protein
MLELTERHTFSTIFSRENLNCSSNPYVLFESPFLCHLFEKSSVESSRRLNSFTRRDANHKKKDIGRRDIRKNKVKRSPRYPLRFPGKEVLRKVGFFFASLPLSLLFFFPYLSSRWKKQWGLKDFESASSYIARPFQKKESKKDQKKRREGKRKPIHASFDWSPIRAVQIMPTVWALSELRGREMRRRSERDRETCRSLARVSPSLSLSLSYRSQLLCLP